MPVEANLGNKLLDKPEWPSSERSSCFRWSEQDIFLVRVDQVRVQGMPEAVGTRKAIPLPSAPTAMERFTLDEAAFTAPHGPRSCPSKSDACHTMRCPVAQSRGPLPD